MDHIAHIGFVHAHAEGDGGDHDRVFLVQEAVEADVALAVVETGVIADGIDAVVAQQLGQAVTAVTAAAINHARTARALGHQFHHAGIGAGARTVDLALGAELKVGAGEAVDKNLCPLKVQGGDDVVAGPGIGGGGHRDARHARKHLGQPTEVAVVGAEVVAPLGDAVGLVDGDKADRKFR